MPKGKGYAIKGGSKKMTMKKSHGGSKMAKKGMGRARKGRR